MKPVIFLPPAERELSETLDFYHQHHPAIGKAFAHEFFRSLDFLKKFPEA